MSAKLAPALFAVSGVMWVSVIVNGSGIMLLWPALASFLSAVAIVRWPAARPTVPLAAASAFLGLTASAYQAAASANLGGTPLAPAAVYSTPIFVAFTLLYALLIVLSVIPRPAAD